MDILRLISNTAQQGLKNIIFIKKAIQEFWMAFV